MASLPPSKRPRRGQQFSRVLQSIQDNREFRAKIKNARASVHLYDRNAPRVKADRALALREYLEFVKKITILDGVFENDVVDSVIWSHAFNKDNVIDLVCEYLAALAMHQIILGTGLLGEKMKIETLRRRASSLWFTVQWELLDHASTLYPTWIHTTTNLTHKLAVDNELSIAKRPKVYYGVPELRLLFLRLGKSMKLVQWYKQNYIACALMLMTGARPGSLALSWWSKSGIAKKDLQCLRWRDIEFYPDLDGVFAVRITLMFLKGQKDPYHSGAGRFRPAEFLMKSCTSPHNLHADVPWLLFALAYERGLFGNGAQDWKTLWQKSTSSILEHDSIVSQRPVFVSAKSPNCPELTLDDPLRAAAFNPPLQRACLEVGLAQYVSMYAWRREFITSVARNTTVTQAREFASHAPPGGASDSYGCYDYGLGDMDVTAVRLGETSDEGSTKQERMQKARNKLRKYLASPAMAQMDTYPSEEEAAFVATVLAGREDIVGMDEVVPLILERIQSQLKIKDTMGLYPTLAFLKEKAKETPAPITVYEEPSATRQDEPEEWFILFENIIDYEHARILLQKFIVARKLLRKWAKHHLRAEFKEDWRKNRRPASQAQIKQRQSWAESPIDLLDQNRPKELHERGFRPFLSLSQREGATGVTPLERNPLQSSLGRWDGTRIDSDDDNDDDDDDDDDEQKEEGEETTVRAVMEAATGDETVVFEMDEIDGVDNESGRRLDPQRLTLMEGWFSWIDSRRGPQICPLCAGSVGGLPTKTLQSAFMLCRHVRETHQNSASDYILSCQNGPKNFRCRLCPAKFRGGSQLHEHLERQHPTFFRKL